MMGINEFIQAMPKADIQVSFEGALVKSALIKIAEKNDIQDTLKHYIDWIKLIDGVDLKRMPELIRLMSSWIQQPQDLSRMVYEIALNLHKQNVRYAEISVNPALYTETGLIADDFMTALNDGRDRAERAWGIKLAWILTIPRDDARRADDVARWVSTIAARRAGIMGMGLIGKEDTQPLTVFERAFGNVEKKGIPTTARAGDTQGANGVINVIGALNPSRIIDGWGVVDSQEALTLLRDKGIALVVNPSRAVKHNWVANAANYPLRRLYDENIRVVIGSDMPTIYRTTLTHEYQQAVSLNGLTIDELCDVALNAVRASFLTDEEKAAMLEQFEADYARLRAEHLATA